VPDRGGRAPRERAAECATAVKGHQATVTSARGPGTALQ
jgi:hypothetical protein